MLHRVRGRGRRRGGGTALGRGGARAPAAPALATLSGPRPPSRFGPVARPRPVRPRCPFRRLKSVGQAAGGKFARLRQRRLCEGSGRGCCPGGAVGAPCPGPSRVWGPSERRAECLGGAYGRTSGREASSWGPRALGRACEDSRRQGVSPMSVGESRLLSAWLSTRALGTPAGRCGETGVSVGAGVEIKRASQSPESLSAGSKGGGAQAQALVFPGPRPAL